jgi:hypothetical protein
VFQGDNNHNSAVSQRLIHGQSCAFGSTKKEQQQNEKRSRSVS